MPGLNGIFSSHRACFSVWNSARMPIRVAIVDDDAAYAESIQWLLNNSPRFECVGVSRSGEEALERLPPLQPSVVLLDIEMGGRSGPECVAPLKARLPETQILMLTVFEDYDRIFDSLRAGAMGYLLKRTAPDELLDAIEDLHRGGSPMSSAIARKVVVAFHENGLTAREKEILQARARGRRYKEIAADLNLSYHTVRTHLNNVYKKLHTESSGKGARRPKLRPPPTPGRG